MAERIWDRTLLLTAVAVAIVSSASVWVAWHTSGDLATHLSMRAVAPVLCAALVSYAFRILRFHYFLLRSGIPISLQGTAFVQCVGFALSVTPGHIGEVFKLHLIRERVGTPVVQSAPLLLLDRLTEGGGFLILAAVSAWMLPALQDRLPVPLMILLGLGALLAFALVFRQWGDRLITYTSRWASAARVSRIVPHVSNLWRGLKASFTLKQVFGGLALSTVARFADGLVVLFAAQIMGLGLEVPEAVFVLGVSGLAGGLSLLPAGTGAVETTMVGLLLFLGAPLANALAITLLARLFTLWLWVALGLVLVFWLRVFSPRSIAKESQKV